MTHAQHGIALCFLRNNHTQLKSICSSSVSSVGLANELFSLWKYSDRQMHACRHLHKHTCTITHTLIYMYTHTHTFISSLVGNYGHCASTLLHLTSVLRREKGPGGPGRSECKRVKEALQESAEDMVSTALNLSGLTGGVGKGQLQHTILCSMKGSHL